MIPPALSGLLVGPQAWLRQRVGGLRIHLEEAAVQGLLSGLAGRLARVCGPCLAEEWRASKAVFGRTKPVGGGAATWDRRRADWPGLGPVIDEVVLRWTESVDHFLGSLRDDGPVLGELLPAGTDRTRVLDLRADAGDPHQRGRAVILVQFDGGRVVFKPRDLRLVRRVAELFADLGAQGWDEPVPVPALRWVDDRTWMAFVESDRVTDAAGAGRFYRRLGGHLRLFQALGARDLWLDNLIACGDEPVWVDLETALHPVPAHRGTPAEQLARRLLNDSPALMSAISMPVPVLPGQPPEDLGVLRPAGLARLPFAADPDVAAALDASWPTRDGRRGLEVGAHCPRTPDGPVDPTAHLPALEEGYFEMDERLAQAGPALALDEGRWRGWRGLPVRYVHRSTWRAYRQLRASVRPDKLAAPRVRGRWLEREVAASDRWGPAEVDALAGGDVPFFTWPVDEAGVDPPWEAPLSAARRRLAQPSPDAWTRTLWSASLACSPAAKPSWQASSTWPALVEGERAARTIRTCALEQSGTVAFLGLVPHRELGFYEPGVLGPGLLGGRAGLAAVLAAWAARDADQYGPLATRTLESVVSAPMAADRSLATGEAGRVLALVRAGWHLGEPWAGIAAERAGDLVAAAATVGERLAALWALLLPEPSPALARLIDELMESLGSSPLSIESISVPAPFDALPLDGPNLAAALAPYVQNLLERQVSWDQGSSAPATAGRVRFVTGPAEAAHLCALSGTGAVAHEALAADDPSWHPLWPMAARAVIRRTAAHPGSTRS